MEYNFRILFYGELKKIEPFSWSEFFEGKLPLSGTDATLLMMAYQLSLKVKKVSLITNASLISIDNLEIIPNVEYTSFTEFVEIYNTDIIIFIHNEKNEYLNLLHKLNKFKCKIVVWAQNSPSKIVSNFYSNLDILKRIVCVSNNQANHLRHYKLFSKCSVIQNFLLFDTLYKNSSQKKLNQVCFLGSITENKGINLLLEVWPKVIKSVPDAQLYIIGSPKLYDRNSQLGKFGLGLPEFEEKYIYNVYGTDRDALKNKNITICGLLAPIQYAKIISESLIGIVNPNYNHNMAVETFCVSAIEIQFYETSVIGGKAGGLLETISNNKSGKLTNSKKELVVKIIDLLKNPNKALSMGMIGKQFVHKNFTMNSKVEDWINLIIEIENDKIPKKIPLRYIVDEPKIFLKYLINLLNIKI